MVRRHEASSFGAAYAFPGGVLDTDDDQVYEYCDGVTAAEANDVIGVSGGLGYYSAAIRELFEETGVLLAAHPVQAKLPAYRDGLNDESLSWAEFVSEQALRLDCRALHYFAHWVTPTAMPKRYSTRFFLAALPPDQRAVHCGRELTDSRWSTARDILEKARSGDLTLHFPTMTTLQHIAQHDSVDAVFAWASEQADRGITSMLPVRAERDGKNVILLPGDEGYPDVRA